MSKGKWKNRHNIPEVIITRDKVTPLATKSDNKSLSEKEDTEEIVDKVISIGEKKLYGISYDNYNVVVWIRNIFKKDTEVSFPSKTKGQMDSKFYKKGEFSPWALAPSPYRTSEEDAFTHIYRLMLREKIKDAGSFDLVEKFFKEVKADMSSVFARK